MLQVTKEISLYKVLMWKHSIHSTIFFFYFSFFWPWTVYGYCSRWNSLNELYLLYCHEKEKQKTQTNQIKPLSTFIFGCVKFHGESWIWGMGKVHTANGKKDGVRSKLTSMVGLEPMPRQLFRDAICDNVWKLEGKQGFCCLQSTCAAMLVLLGPVS